jgi:hypothetical protein
VTCDLERVFGALADLVPEQDEDEEAQAWNIVFSAENLPRAPAELRTDDLALSWGLHDYGATPIEMVDFCAAKRTLRLLGLLILAKVFHEGPEHVTLHLGMPGLKTAAAIRRLVLDYRYDASERLGYAKRPDLFRYMPNSDDKHPWYGSALQPRDMPVLYLTGPDWEMGHLAGPDNRETAVGFGGDEGNVLFAELLMNASMPWNDGDEYALEGESGFRGAGPGSAEIRIFLPGHLFHDDPVPWR